MLVWCAYWTDNDRAQVVTVVVRAANTLGSGTLASAPTTGGPLGTFSDVHATTTRQAEYVTSKTRQEEYNITRIRER